MLDNNTIEDIRNKLDIVEVINTYITLEKKGKNYFGVCPFHDDHSPSMSVSPSLQIFNCFTCKSGGNVFKFVSDYENISFHDAVIKLANSINYPINITSAKPNNNQIKNNEIYNIYDISNKFFINNIHTKGASEALDYLSSRNISNETIKFFEIGLASMINPLSKFLLVNNFSSSSLINYGILSDNGYDIFNNRIMIPIHNHNGQVIAWTGRIYNNNDTNKYLNSKETSIFKKGSTLFNYHRAISFIKKEDNIIIVEGNMDVIRLVNHKINNCVALMGTSLTNEQIALIKRLTNNITLCLDSDKAGINATNVIANELYNKGFNVKITMLEKDSDPDEYIVKYGAEAFLNILNNSINFFDYKLNVLKNERNFSNLEEISAYLKDVINELNKSNDEILKEMTLNKLSNDYNISIDTLKSMIIKKEVIKQQPLVKPNKDNKFDKASKRIIKMMLLDENGIYLVKDKLSYFIDEKYKILSEEIIYYFKKHAIIEIADLCTFLNDKGNLQSLFLEIINEYEDYLYNEEELLDYINLLNNQLLSNQKKILQDKLKSEFDPIKKAQLVNEILKLGDKI